ncbi:ROK family protein, partial [Bacillus haynesii]|uniref:ROK family protein n=1 Tax=Bacillus haynesii TaxID=1925021 RepID=UPI003990587D
HHHLSNGGTQEDRVSAVLDIRVQAVRPGNGCANLVFITLGTGVGGGVIVEGHLVHGKGAAGEIGHMIVDHDGYQCTCGNRGCLETVAIGTGVVRLARDLSEEFAGESKLKWLIDDGQEVTAKIIFDQAKQVTN